MINSNYNAPISNSEPTIKVYGYRWIIIAIFASFNAINFFQFLQFTVIGDIIQTYYGIDETLTQMSGVVFMLAFILLFIPVGYIVENTSLKTSSMIGAGLTAVGNCLKLLAISPGNFYWVIISQSFCAVAQVFMLITPSKIASVWFGAEEVSTACAIGLFGTQIGLALGAVVPALMVTNKDVQDGLTSLFIYNASISVILFIFVILFFRSKPQTPPSNSQAELSSSNQDDRMTYWLATKGFLKNRDYLIVLSTIGIGYGIWTSFGILVNQIFTKAFPDDHGTDLGILTCITCISGGCFGTMFFGYILDKTHKFKLVAFTVLLANTLAGIIQAAFFIKSYKPGVMIIVPINGFFSGSLMVIGFEYAIETTYPTPEAFGAAILNTVIYVFGILYVLFYNIVVDNISYAAGQIIFVASLALATFGTIFISPELRRRNANLKFEVNEGFTKDTVE